MNISIFHADKSALKTVRPSLQRRAFIPAKTSVHPGKDGRIKKRFDFFYRLPYKKYPQNH